MTDWVQQVHKYHCAGMSYRNIGKVMGMSKNKVLAAHRRMRTGMSSTKFYQLKSENPEAIETQITLPKVYGVNNNKYVYKECSDDRLQSI